MFILFFSFALQIAETLKHFSRAIINIRLSTVVEYSVSVVGKCFLKLENANRIRQMPKNDI